jgi:F0F1-type ATP synthase membrane subunit b/b'
MMKGTFRFLIAHWKEVALALLLFAVSFLWWRDHKGLIDAYDASVESYEVRIKELKQSHERETERKAEALEQYKAKMAELETEYFEYKQAIEEAKKERVRDFVTLRQEDPNKLIVEIEAKFGFEHVD